MDITQAKRVIELSKPDSSQKILVTLWQNNIISTCVEEAAKKYCESCQGDEGLCLDYIEDMKARGYQMTEVELSELTLEESLPKFLQDRAGQVEPSVAFEAAASAAIEEEPEPNGEAE